jgi:hypothetical protein
MSLGPAQRDKERIARRQRLWGERVKAMQGQGLLDTAALTAAPIPLLGDALGLAADSSRMYNDPEERTPLNFAMAGLGLLPFVPRLSRGSKTVADANKVVEAPKEVNVAKRFKEGDKAGTYRGSEAFGGINPSKLGSMRKDYVELMEQGADAYKWYDEASGDILRLTGGVTPRADDLANILAVTSSGTPVGSNTMYAFKGWNQMLADQPLSTGKYPTAMGEAIKKQIETEAGTASGLKRSPFSAGLSVGWRGQDFANRPVHDIHDVRAWGITDPKTGRPWEKGVGAAGHRFLDEQGAWVSDKANSVKLAGKDDWTPYRAQAAAWTAQKMRKEGTGAAEAGRHYGDFINDYSSQITRSWTPGATTGHMQGLLSDPALQKRFNDELESVISGPGGIDMIAHRLGALSDKTLPNAGLYEGRPEAGFASLLPVGKATGSHMLDPSSKTVLDSVAATHGLLGVQDQVAHNFIGGPSPLKSAGAVRFRTPDGQPLELEALRKLQEDLPQFGADIPQVDPRGARSLLFDAPSGQQVKGMREAASRHGLLEPEFGTRDGNLFPLKEGSAWEKPDNWSAKPYIEKIEAGGPNIVENFNSGMPEIAGQLLEKVDAFSKANNLTQASWYRPMMEAIQSGGLPALKDLVARGIVPAALLAAIAPSLLESDPSVVQ